MVVDFEDLISSTSSTAGKPSIIEALLSTVDAIFTNNRMLQRSRLSSRNIRGVVRVIGSQAFLRARLERSYKPFLDSDSGEFTYSRYDNRVLTAVCEGTLSGRISLDGKSRDEIIRIFQAVGNTGQEQPVGRGGGILGRFDY
ncbi:MAG: hypothetical protein PHT14_11310 [Petrimonas sp.]|nr:hypothetical protein [Petrimonas sp.]